MDGEDRSTDNSIISLPDDQNSTGQRDDASTNVDAAAYVDALVYGELPLPLNISFAKAAGIEAQANAAQKLEGSERFSIGNPGGGSLGAKTEDTRREQSDDNTREYLSVAFEAERERQREAWAQEMHSFGNVSMTGADWGKFASELHKDSALRRWLVERIKKDGKTAAEAEVIADKVASVGDIVEIPEAQRTPEQKARLEALRRDPEIGKYADEAARYAQQSHSAPKTAAEKSIAEGSASMSASGRADELRIFDSAPDTSVHFSKAAAVKPLDAPAPMEISQIEKPIPPSVAASGLDLG